MIPFVQARRELDAVDQAAKVDEGGAALLWDAVAFLNVPKGGSYRYADAVVETVSPEHAMLVTGERSAAAYAFAMHVRFGPAPASAYVKPKPVPSFELRDLARHAWDRFDERSKEVEEVARGFGWDLSEAWKTVADTELRSVPEALRVAGLAGRMYAALRGALAQKVSGIPEETHSIELGSDIPRLLPTELAQLADPDFELSVLARIVEKRALQYEVRGSAPKERGPIVLALDESGSMHADRRVWSKSVALAVARVAGEQKRHVSVVHFSTVAHAAELRPKDPQSVLAMIRHWYNGGTDIGRALRVAGAEVERLDKTGKGGSDVILVTDGIDENEYSQREATKKLSELGARLWTVAIDAEVRPTSAIRELAAEYTHVSDRQMGDPATVGIFSKAVGS